MHPSDGEVPTAGEDGRTLSARNYKQRKYYGKCARLQVK